MVCPKFDSAWRSTCWYEEDGTVQFKPCDNPALVAAAPTVSLQSKPWARVWAPNLEPFFTDYVP